ncbi:hypothetical protein L833_5061 [Mycobacteroides abscessus MAB_091912_2446]|uniref:Uncharacterized protein n=1 Tax=Mycobacteroides abscessus MAB_091912_2446 TaxID=1335414 RepID=A0A829M4Z5_9MYCO|nr:hypothetical protein L833_5061 [Mycobacteroides abscessus MAB_091912_2446]
MANIWTSCPNLPVTNPSKPPAGNPIQTPRVHGAATVAARCRDRRRGIRKSHVLSAMSGSISARVQLRDDVLGVFGIRR